MKRLMLIVVGLILLSSQILLAQAVWQDEVVVRKLEFIDWGDAYSNNNDSFVTTSTNDVIVLLSKGSYANQGLFVHKINVQGEPVWGEDILIAGSENTKWSPSIVSAGDGNFFVIWKETNSGSVLRVTKINSNGQFLWEPNIALVTGTESMTYKVQHDNNGGLYIVYNKNVPDFGTDIYCQHISSGGQLLLPVEGVEISHDNLSEYASFVCLAADNSLVIGYHTIYNNVSCLRIQRMTSDHQIAWTFPMLLGVPNSYCSFSSVVTIDSLQFVVCWSENGNTHSYSYMQKIDLTGNMLYVPAVLIAQHTNSSLYTTLNINTNGEIFSAIHKGSNTPPMLNIINKYGFNGVPLWGDGISLPDSISQLVVSSTDSNGGCYVLQRHLENYDPGIYGYSFQHLDSNGQPLWDNGGIVIENHIPSEFCSQMKLAVTDRFTFVWVKKYNDRQGLYYQIRNLNGQLTTPSRITLHDALAGEAQNVGSIARESDILVYWNDDRSTSYPQYGWMTYYQIVHPDGTMQLPEDGMPLVNNAATSGYKYEVACLSNGNTIFFWTKFINNQYYIMGQSVSRGGFVMWEPQGRTLISYPVGYAISDPIIWSEANDVYIAWSRRNTDYQTQAIVQKLSNEQLMWGNEGLVISSNLPNLDNYECPLDFKNRYLTLESKLTNPERSVIWVTHLEIDGSISPQWHQATESQVICSVYSHSQIQFELETAILYDKLFLAYLLHSPNYYGYSYSIIGSDATVWVTREHLFNDLNTNRETGLCIDTSDNLVMSILQTNANGPCYRISYGKISNPEEYPWGEIPQLVYSSNGYLHPTFAGISAFNGGGYAIYWFENYYIYGGFISSSGTYLSPTGGNVWFTSSNILPKIAKLGNELYFTWEDFKLAQYSYYGSEIRMQKYANPTVGVSDETTSSPSAKLLCYPNPFIDNLNLNYTITQKGKATLSVYNVKGQKVRTLLSGNMEKGTQAIFWDGKNEAGRQVSSGIYYIRLEYGKTCTNKKVVCIKN